MLGAKISKYFWEIKWLLTLVNSFSYVSIHETNTWRKKSLICQIFLQIEEKRLWPVGKQVLGSGSMWWPLKGEGVLAKEVLSSKMAFLKGRRKWTRQMSKGDTGWQRKGNLIRSGRGVCLALGSLNKMVLEYYTMVILPDNNECVWIWKDNKQKWKTDGRLFRVLRDEGENITNV